MKSGFDRITFTRDPELIEEAHIYKQPILNLILAALLQPSFLRPELNRPRLNNEDVVKLARGRLSESVVIRVIEVYESDFDVSGEGLTRLRRSGVGDKVIEAILSKASPSAGSVQALAPPQLEMEKAFSH
jgi:hypothetical protein